MMTESALLAFAEVVAKFKNITARMKKLGVIGSDAFQREFSEGLREGQDAGQARAEATSEENDHLQVVKVLQTASRFLDLAIADMEAGKFVPPKWQAEFADKHGQDWQGFVADLRRDWRAFEDARQRYVQSEGDEAAAATLH
ncbi:hypothetical protein [Bradyrhizobium viridifuturi]|uniref:hypothetical protein n=1 Tax=Bradyrhizobium viridifuturi TaxID=1654716 RepID=UPI00067F0BC0|nr:hypothetical protein [Bradyrhizobium viridifuturi]